MTDEILSICQAANVQLMDGTMWSHSDRVRRMEEAVAARLEPSGMGPLKAVTCTFCCAGESGHLHTSSPLPSLLRHANLEYAQALHAEQHYGCKYQAFKLVPVLRQCKIAYTDPLQRQGASLGHVCS